MRAPRADPRLLECSLDPVKNTQLCLQSIRSCTYGWLEVQGAVAVKTMQQKGVWYVNVTRMSRYMCWGKTDVFLFPCQVLPEVLKLHTSSSPAQRCVVVTAVKVATVPQPHPIDDVLCPAMLPLLQLISDPDRCSTTWHATL